MSAQRPQAMQQIAAPVRLPALAWPGVVVAVMSGRLAPWVLGIVRGRHRLTV